MSKKTVASMTSSEIHEAGAAKFGLRWLRANETAVHAAVRCGFNYTAPKHKKVMSLVVYHILETFFDPKSPSSREYWEIKRRDAEFTDGGGI